MFCVLKDTETDSMLSIVISSCIELTGIDVMLHRSSVCKTNRFWQIYLLPSKYLATSCTWSSSRFASEVLGTTRLLIFAMFCSSLTRKRKKTEQC